MSAYLFLLIIIIPLIGSFSMLFAKNDQNYALNNVYNLSIWVLGCNATLILYTMSLFDIEKTGIQLVEKYQWFNIPPIDILLGADMLSLLLLLSINISFMIADICIYRTVEHAKTLLSAQLLFIGLLNGYILSADIISFWSFFATMSIPLIILMSMYVRIQKKNMLIRFSLYNLAGVFILFMVVLIIYNYKANNIPLNTAGNLNLKGKREYIVWFSLFLAFISRMPIWPFHYWLSVINSTLRNPLVFMIGGLFPLVGLYGFMRFWPNTVPQTIGVYAPLFEGICIVTMLLISFMSLSYKDFRYKLFAYMTIYYILYLISVFLPTSGLKMNIGQALFSYIIIITVLSLLISHLEYEKKKIATSDIGGILCYMPRASICLSLFILAGIGLPVTPLFFNNFIIISEIVNHNLTLGILSMISLYNVALSLLSEIYHLKNREYIANISGTINDLPQINFIIYISCFILLVISFFKPLWSIF